MCACACVFACVCLGAPELNLFVWSICCLVCDILKHVEAICSCRTHTHIHTHTDEALQTLLLPAVDFVFA